jgi:hypothetical protein
MAIADAIKTKLNKMNRASQDAFLGTVIQDLQNASVVRGKYTVVQADQNAGSKTINTGVTINGFIVQVYRGGVLEPDCKVTATTTNLKVENNSSDYAVTTGDVINYIVW